jgi:hypothetical protein
MLENEENADTKLLREWRDVQIWRVNYTPVGHRRSRVATYLVQVIGENAESFRLPSAAWERFENLCDRVRIRQTTRGPR